MSTGLNEELDTEEMPSVQEMYQMLQSLQDTVTQQQERIQELEEELEERPAVEKRGDTGKPEDIWIGNHPIGLMAEKSRDRSAEALELAERQENALEDAEELRQDIINEQKARSRADGAIERKVGLLADEVDVDIADSEVAGEDKIVRLLKYGPEDVTDRVYTVHERARDVLEHAGLWGKKTGDSTFGSRITLRSTDVREGLEVKRNEDLQPKQIRDVFQKIVELAEDSPRKVRMGKSDDGVNKLVVYLTEEEVSE